ncbi:MAG: hypothetical protein WC989_07495 [Micavibrio sp.]
MTARHFNKGARERRKQPKQTRFLPDNCGAYVVLFRNIEPSSNFHELNDSVLLIIEDEKESNFLFGAVINENHQLSFYKYLEAQNEKLRDHFRFIAMADAGKDGFEPFESNFAGFLMQADSPRVPPQSVTNKKFAYYAAESAQEAKEIAEHLYGEEDLLILYSQFFIPRDEVERLARKKQAVIRPASSQAIFNSSAFMRGLLSFPEHFGRPFNNPAPEPGQV